VRYPNSYLLAVAEDVMDALILERASTFVIGSTALGMPGRDVDLITYRTSSVMQALTHITPNVPVVHRGIEVVGAGVDHKPLWSKYTFWVERSRTFGHQSRTAVKVEIGVHSVDSFLSQRDHYMRVVKTVSPETLAIMRANASSKKEFYRKLGIPTNEDMTRAHSVLIELVNKDRNH